MRPEGERQGRRESNAFVVKENRRVAGVVERGALEMRCPLAGTGGSNPSLSANVRRPQRLTLGQFMSDYKQQEPTP